MEALELKNRRYYRVETYGPGDTIDLPLFPGEKVCVDELFQTQSGLPMTYVVDADRAVIGTLSR